MPELNVRLFSVFFFFNFKDTAPIEISITCLVLWHVKTNRESCWRTSALIGPWQWTLTPGWPLVPPSEAVPYNEQRLDESACPGSTEVCLVCSSHPSCIWLHHVYVNKPHMSLGVGKHLQRCTYDVSWRWFRYPTVLLKMSVINIKKQIEHRKQTTKTQQQKI